MAGAPVVSAELRTLDLVGGAREGLRTCDWRPVRAQTAVPVVTRRLGAYDSEEATARPVLYTEKPGNSPRRGRRATRWQLRTRGWELLGPAICSWEPGSRRLTLQHAGPPGPSAERG